jgi:hypothetical protein
MVVKNRAYGYRRTQDGGFSIDMTALDVIGDGAIYTTVEDFFRWDQNFYDNKLGAGSQSLIDLVQTPGLLNDGERMNYAYGLGVGSYRGLTRISHSGSWVGFRSIYMRFPERHFSVVIFTNNGISPESHARRIVDMYLRDAFTEPPQPRAERNRQAGAREPRPDPVELTPAQKRDLSGIFYSAELDEYATIRVVEGNLTLKLGRTHGTLTTLSPEVLRWRLRRMEFSRDSEGILSGFDLKMGDNFVLSFVRIK